MHDKWPLVGRLRKALGQSSIALSNLNKQRKKHARVGFHYSIELNFTNEDAKQLFLLRMEDAKQHNYWLPEAYCP